MSSSSPLPAEPLKYPSAASAPDPERFTVHAWSQPLRGLALAARLVALGCLPLFSGWLVMDILTAGLPSALPLRGLGLGVALPWVLATVLRWSAHATAEVEATQLVLALRSGARMELPYDAMESVRPWKLPLPGPGLSLRMKSGRAFAYGLETEDAAPLLEALGRHATLGEAGSHALVRYAQERHALWRRRWYHVVGKHLVYPLLPTAIIFQLNQRITFGSPFGEYQYFGLAAYLRAFGRDFLQVAPFFLLAACLFRVLVEAVSLLAAWLTPSRARGARRGAEWLGRLTYYVGLLALLAARLLS
ncbi:hypothetical protein [Pyxidicoccus trucidator]|uniref:hypothetical protein n=1 Tax=Pyxidicoccus trucidator TaxID=2709662 RepID=UPI001F07BB31|nr:hypothetical protein [Pyxidicoccus trucidator]